MADEKKSKKEMQLEQLKEVRKHEEEVLKKTLKMNEDDVNSEV